MKRERFLNFLTIVSERPTTLTSAVSGCCSLLGSWQWRRRISHPCKSSHYSWFWSGRFIPLKMEWWCRGTHLICFSKYVSALWTWHMINWTQVPIAYLCLCQSFSSSERARGGVSLSWNYNVEYIWPCIFGNRLIPEIISKLNELVTFVFTLSIVFIHCYIQEQNEQRWEWNIDRE